MSKLFVTLLSISILSMPVHALDINKCIDANGNVSYISGECPTSGKSVKLKTQPLRKYGPQDCAGFRPAVGAGFTGFSVRDMKENPNISEGTKAYWGADYPEAEKHFKKYLQENKTESQNYAARVLIHILCIRKQYDEVQEISQRYGIPLPLKDANEQCSQTVDCKQGLICTNNRCVLEKKKYTKGAGEPCKEHDECGLGGLMCIEGKCQTPK